MDDNLKDIKAIIRLTSQQDMNRTEARFDLSLRCKMQAGEILWYAFEPIKLRLGKSVFYTPDFFAICDDLSVVVYEVKGFWRDDARVKIKVAASLFPWMQFHAVTWKKDRWETETFFKE